MRVSTLSTTLGLLLVLVSAPAGHAELATEQEASLVSQNWVSYVVSELGHWSGTSEPSVSGQSEIVDGGRLLGWCFDVVPKGFVVVPALKEMTPVKAYSDDSNLDPDDDGLAALLREVLSDRIDRFESRYGSASAKQTPDEFALFSPDNGLAWKHLSRSPDSFRLDLEDARLDPIQSVGPLLTTRWHQYEPYNSECPQGYSAPTIVGCVATAASQIMRYHEWPPYGTGHHYYVWDGDDSVAPVVDTIPLWADFRDAYDWANMPDSLDAGWTPEEEAAVGELCHEVGVALEMDYGEKNSTCGTYGGRCIFPMYFAYKPTTFCAHRGDFEYARDWFDLVQSEVDAGRPMLYRIKWHAVVCDGWRTGLAGMEYHINYGSGGSATAWYMVDRIVEEGEPEEEEYVIGGIEPDDDGETFFSYGTGNRLRDFFDLGEFFSDARPRITVVDASGVVAVSIAISSDEWATQESYECQRLEPGSDVWLMHGSLSSEFFPAFFREHRYFFEAVDGLGRASRWPRGAPAESFEFSYLPIGLDTGPTKSILLVDKSRSLAPAAGGKMPLQSRTIYEESLEIMGYEWDEYNVDLPAHGDDQSRGGGPMMEALDYYDTVLWITGNSHILTLTESDITGLTLWWMSPGEQRLLLTGNDVGGGCRRTGVSGSTWRSFVGDYLGMEELGQVLAGTMSCEAGQFRDGPGPTPFLDAAYGGVFHQGCPRRFCFEQLEPFDNGYGFTESAIECETDTSGYVGAGVAFDCPVPDYKTVTLGFGLEYMVGGVNDEDQCCPYESGVESRWNLLGHILGFFGKSPTTDSWSDVPDSELARNALSAAYPNPSNPATRIEYSVREGGPSTIVVYNVAGERVRTLLERNLDAGASGTILWDGRNNRDEAVASGVYFYVIRTPSWRSSRRLVLLR